MTGDSELLYLVVTICIYLESSLFCLFFIPFLVLQRTLGSLKIINSCTGYILFPPSMIKLVLMHFLLHFRELVYLESELNLILGNDLAKSYLEPQFFHHQRDQDELDGV